MSFAAPVFLLALLAIPLLIAAQVAATRRRRRYAVRFPATSSLAAAAAAEGWVARLLKHVPAALLLAAMGALAIGLARPQKTVAVAIDRATIMLVTDHSRSMQATDVQPNRLVAAQRAARSFLDRLPAGVRVGAVAYSDTPDSVEAPSTDHSQARGVVDSQVADGATATGDALAVALDVLQRDHTGKKPPPSAIVLLSDGKTTIGRDPVEVARAAAKLKVPIFTVALGTREATVPNPYPFQPPLPVAPDPETLRQISKASGGQAFTAEDDTRLSSIYRTLGTQLGQKQAKKEVTATFAILGFVLLLGAGAASLRLAGRVA
ncbi:MAG: VWA domain-containing protein [Solirubrobacteraceae bacterium]